MKELRVVLIVGAGLEVRQLSTQAERIRLLPPRRGLLTGENSPALIAFARQASGVRLNSSAIARQSGRPAHNSESRTSSFARADRLKTRGWWTLAAAA